MAKEKDSISSTGVVYNSLTYGSKIIGKIIADKDYRIDGEIEGEIICSGKVVIGQKGLLKGTLQCAFADQDPHTGGGTQGRARRHLLNDEG